MSRRDPYTPVSRDELNDPDLTGDALQLLLRIRAFSDGAMSDGVLSPRQCAALRELHGITRWRFTRILKNLCDSAHVSVNSGAITDVNFLLVCRGSAQRLAEKEAWQTAKANWRAQNVQPGQEAMSSPDNSHVRPGRPVDADTKSRGDADYAQMDARENGFANADALADAEAVAVTAEFGE